MLHCLYEKSREQQRFTILEVAAHWHELVVPRRDMQPSIASNSGHADPRRITTDIPPPQSAAVGLHPVAPPPRRTLLINRPRIKREKYTVLWNAPRNVESPDTAY